MKVLHISDSKQMGGAEIVFQETIKASASLGYTNYEFVSNNKTDPLNYIFSLKNARSLKKLLNDIEPDLVHIHNYYHYLSPSILYVLKRVKQNRNIKVIFTAHDFHLICPNSGYQVFNNNIRKNFSFDRKVNIRFSNKYDDRTWFHSFLKLIQHLICYNVLKLHNVFDVIISPSYFLKGVFKTNGIKSPIKVIRNPLAILEYTRFFDKNQKNSLINKSSKYLRIAYAGRVVREKGILEIILKFNYDCNMPLELNLYGSFDKDYKDEIDMIKLRDDFIINFHGYIDNEILSSHLSENDLFVLPSLWCENAPLSIIEAAFLGLPILTLNYGGMAEMAKETTKYFLFDWDSDLSVILQRVKSDCYPNSLIRIGDYRFKNYVDNIGALYKELVSS